MQQYHFHNLNILAMYLLFFKHKNQLIMATLEEKVSCSKDHPGELSSSWASAGWLRMRCPSGSTCLESHRQTLYHPLFRPSNLPESVLLWHISTGSGKKKVWKDCGIKTSRTDSWVKAKLHWLLLCVGNKLKPLGFQFSRWFIRSLSYLILNPAVLFYVRKMLKRLK